MANTEQGQLPTSSSAVDDLRRRCLAHGHWMTTHPDVAEFASEWGDRNLETLAQRGR
ncbi:hypothetical protein [Mycolicibacterium fortuitum]|uniref:hypothetical protein n=1 Tax=Mycolicibacterium fortuitum TaxID=1766 RepID=UPI001CE1B4DA|nr:hypothetical protein [Mycolicibacterium fortuitum]MCA4727483.1 hypothetical protein [Mycolicibacterium fortuitum]